jgi:hypothetical protein
MVTNTDKPVGPGTFTRGGNSVTIAEDGKILVQRNDWLSKYSYALYGDYETLDVFVRPNPPFRSATDEIKGIKEIDNPDRIETGEYLIHVPTWFSFAEKRGKPRPKRPYWPRPVPADPDNRLDVDRLKYFLRYLKQWFLPVTDWEFVTSSGADLSFSWFTAHYVGLGLKRPFDAAPIWFYAVGAGVNVGLEDFGIGGSVSRPSMPSIGYVGKSPLVGLSLSPVEIAGTYLLLDVSAGEGIGASAAIMFFGFNNPVDAMIRNAVRYFRGIGGDWPILPSLCHGAVVMAGLNATTPNIGVTIKGGYMHRAE